MAAEVAGPMRAVLDAAVADVLTSLGESALGTGTVTVSLKDGHVQSVKLEKYQRVRAREKA